MKTDFRRRFFYCLVCEVNGHPEGALLPRWAVWLHHFLFPITALRWWATGMYDPMSDCLTINGVRISMELLRCMTRELEYYPGDWMRVVKRNDYGFGGVYLELQWAYNTRCLKCPEGPRHKVMSIDVPSMEGKSCLTV